VLREKVEANERLRADQQRLGLLSADRLPFLCECDDVQCREIILLTDAAYGDARSSATRHVCVEGHPHEGRVIAVGEGYVIAEAE
jgi:hypothetical protein